jgi:type VI secretion system protein ImpJ
VCEAPGRKTVGAPIPNRGALAVSRKPLWTEGLFVSQHHFQLQDLYHEALLRDRIAAVRRFDWGILDLEVDERLLQAGQFRLQRLEAVWPDGLVVQCGGTSETPTPEPRSFEGLFAPEAPYLDVFAGLASESTSTGNVAAPGEPALHRRFSRVSQAVGDFNTGAATQEVELAVPNLRILFGPEPRERLSAVQVAQLVRQPGGRVIVRDNFVPPVLRISAAPFLTGGLQRVLGALISRQRDLASARKQRNVSNIEFHFTDARRFWLLHTLNGAIPRLSHLLNTKAHPEEVYLALAELVGQLGTFAADADPASVPAFSYTELGELFEWLFARVLSLLAVDSVATYVEVALERRQDGMFVGKIVEPRLTNHEFFVAVKSALPEAIVRERVPQLLKIASWAHIFDVVKQARQGVRAEVEWHPSSALPLKPGICFFRLRREGPFWEEIARSATVALYLPVDADWRDALIQVYAVSPEYLR